MNTNHQARQGDEIDLVEIFCILWNKKWRVCFFTALCCFIGSVYVLVSDTKWTSTAELAPARLSQMGYYSDFQNQVSPQGGDEVQKMADMQQIALAISLAFNREIEIPDPEQQAAESFFDILVESLVSRDVRRAFIEQSEIYQSLLGGKNSKRGLVEKRKLNDLLNDIKVVLPDKKDKKITQSISISLSGSDPEFARKALEEYVNYAERDALVNVRKNFEAIVKRKIAKYKWSLKDIESKIDIAKKIQIENIDQALKIANKAGVHSIQPVVSEPSLSDPFLFLMGTKYLISMREVISSSDGAYPDLYYEIQRKKQAVEKQYGEIASMDTIPLYRYVISPSAPLIKDSPKKLIIFVCALLGFILGVFIVLIQNALNNRRFYK